MVSPRVGVSVFVQVGVGDEGVAVVVEKGVVSVESRGGFLYAYNVGCGGHEEMEEVGEGVSSCVCT